MRVQIYVISLEVPNLFYGKTIIVVKGTGCRFGNPKTQRETKYMSAARCSLWSPNSQIACHSACDL